MLEQSLQPEPASGRSPEAKRALLAQMLEQRATRVQRHPLSFAQRRLWLTDRLELGTDAYNAWTFSPLLGPPDAPAFVAALRELTRRHATLRTSFGEVDGEPYQVVAPGAEPEVVIVDLCALPIATADMEARRLATAEAGRPFDLSRAPLLRTALFRLDAGEALVALVMHHIVSDAWSLRILARELDLLYQAFSTGKPSPLTELAIQYVDFVRWQRQWLQGEVLARHLAYWKGQLADAPVLEMPTDRPRSAVPSFRGASQVFTFPVNLHEAFPALRRSEGTTAFMILLATIKALLFRYTNQQDLCIGSPFAGRPRQELEGLIGYFVNMVVLRTRLDAQTTFRDLVERVRQTTLDAYSYQELPFEKLLAELNPSRDAARNAFFQVAFSLQNVPDAAAAPDPDSNPLYVERRTVKFEMMFEVAEGPWGVHGLLEYNRDLFDRSTVQRLIQHARNLLRDAASKPGEPIGALPLISRAERQQLLREWNDTASDGAAGPLVHELVAFQATARPSAPAVVCGGRALTYGDLHRRSVRLARRLRASGVGPEVAVALILPRSPELVVAALGVLLAGGAYVPIDPHQPRERLELLLADVGAPVVIGEGGWEEGGAEEPAAPLPGVGPEHSAYVIYTSGSTGRPKGVKVPHRGLANLVSWHREVYQVGPRDRAALVASPGFDASVWEMWPYLASGAALHIPDEETRSSPAALVAWLAAEEVTLCFLPTPLAEAVLAEPWPAGAPLRALLTGGDRLQRRPPAGSGFALVNHYGPTESTVVATYTRVAPEAPGAPALGRPIAGMRVHLLDVAGSLVPVGVIGELWIAGTGLASGYLGQPDVTADRFRPDPLAETPGERLYRTGDLARRLPDGSLVFLGRADAQVKIRGFRVEPGEIEVALARHPGVREAVVVARPTPRGDQSLVAFVAPAAEGVSTDELRRFLAAALPDYMVPPSIVSLPALPLTASGKVDRRALPLPAAAAAEAAGEPARTATEELIAGCWAEVLGVGRVGVHDRFFELGGHSLLAVQIVSRIRQQMGVDLPLRWIFDHPTVAELAEHVEAARLAARGLSLPPLAPVPRSGPLPLSFEQERLWFIDQLEPGSPAYNVPAAVQLAGRLDVAALRRALRAVAARHEVFRTRFAAFDGAPVQVIAAAGEMPLHLVDLSALQPGRRVPVARSLAQAEARRPFELAIGPVCRFVLLRLGPESHLLCATLHHIACDAWSLEILVEELLTLYRAFAAGGRAALPDLPVQYADFAAWQRQVMRGEVLDRQLDHWRRHLGSGPPVLRLPYDRAPEGAPSHRGERLPFELPRNLSTRLVELSRREGVTLFMTLMASFDLFLSRLTRQEDVVLGVSIANRNRRELEPLIGFFINLLAMRVDLRGAATFRELLRRVREVVLEGLAYQDLPYAKLVQELRLERRLGTASLFQVVFNFVSARPREAAPGRRDDGLQIRRVEIGGEPVRWNLMLTVGESAGAISGFWTYSTDVFVRATVERMHAGFENLLRQVAAQPAARMGELETRSREEKERQAEEHAALVLKRRLKLLHARPRKVRIPSDNPETGGGERS